MPGAGRAVRTRSGEQPEVTQFLDRQEAELANLRAALAWLDETGDADRVLRLAGALGWLWAFRGYRLEGRAWLRRALAMGGTEPPAARATALFSLGDLERQMGGSDAIDLLHESLELWRTLGDAQGIADAVMTLGIALSDRADHDRAIRCWKKPRRGGKPWMTLPGSPSRACISG